MDLCLGDLDGLFACVAGMAPLGRAKMEPGTPAKVQRDLINPCTDPRWAAHAPTHPKATVFHGEPWARVLQESYGHRPFYVWCRSENGAPVLLPLMEVRSWLTGKRGVSLPFTDFCECLGGEIAPELFEELCELGARRGWRHLEFRGRSLVPPMAKPSISYLVHELDLSGGFAAVEKRMAGSALGATRKARSCGVTAEITDSLEAMRAYYRLHAGTRRRHGLPPQPWRFFENIHRSLISHGSGFLAMAQHQGRVVAGAVFLYSQKQAVYKFSASDYAFQLVRPANLVMATAIRHLAELGCDSLHFGRTSGDNDGLRRFKRAWGTEEQKLDYYRYDLRRRAWTTAPERVSGPHNAFFRRMPATLNRVFGALLYPHLD